MSHQCDIWAQVFYTNKQLFEPECTKEHITSNGENKTPDEKTMNLTAELNFEPCKIA